MSLATGVVRRSASPNQRLYPLQLRSLRMHFWFCPQNSPGTNRSLHYQVGTFTSRLSALLSFLLLSYWLISRVRWHLVDFLNNEAKSPCYLFIYFYSSSISMRCLLNWHMKHNLPNAIKQPILQYFCMFKLHNCQIKPQKVKLLLIK